MDKVKFKDIFGLLRKTDYYIILAVFVFLLGFFIFTFFTPNYNNNGEEYKVYIKPGMTLDRVANALKRDGVINDAVPFKISAYLYGAERNIKAGRYTIKDGLSYIELVEILTKGAPDEQTLVTIPEGIWQHKLAGLLQANLAVDSAKIMELGRDKKFIKSLGLDVDNLEGYLLPETYYFFDDAREKSILRKLASETTKLLDSHKEQMEKLGMNRHQILTMASIIDGESNEVSEFKRISGVYNNRLRIGMPLEADPTVQYLLRNTKRFNKVYKKDLAIDSPYNTYMYRGLPPGPINNPGKDAILAALYPEKHKYLFFVVTSTGSHKFAKTYKEHIRNAQEYYRWRDSRK